MLDVPAVDLLGHVAEEGERALGRDRRSERAQHRRGEILTLVDHDMMSLLRVVPLKFGKYGTGDVIPVVQEAGVGAHPRVLLSDRPRRMDGGRARTRRRDQTDQVDTVQIEAVQVDEPDLVGEEPGRPLERRAGIAVRSRPHVGHGRRTTKLRR